MKCPSCGRGTLYLIESEKFKDSNVSICDQCLDVFIDEGISTGISKLVYCEPFTIGFRDAVIEMEKTPEDFKEMVRTYPVYHGLPRKFN